MSTESKDLKQLELQLRTLQQKTEFLRSLLRRVRSEQRKLACWLLLELVAIMALSILTMHSYLPITAGLRLPSHIDIVASFLLVLTALMATRSFLALRAMWISYSQTKAHLIQSEVAARLANTTLNRLANSQ